MQLVMVVEDEYGNAEMLQLLLESEGFRVVSASNGVAGIELLAGEKPALILRLHDAARHGRRSSAKLQAEQSMRELMHALKL